MPTSFYLTGNQSYGRNNQPGPDIHEDLLFKQTILFIRQSGILIFITARNQMQAYS